MKRIIMSVIMLLFLALSIVGCQADQQQSKQQQNNNPLQEESFTLKQDGVEMQIKGLVLHEVDHVKLDSKLSNLFDGDPNTGCFIVVTDYKTSLLKITMSKPVYLKSVVLNNKMVVKNDAINSLLLVHKIGVVAYQGYHSYLFGGGIPSYELIKPGQQILDLDKDDLLKLLKVGYIEVKIPQEEMGDAEEHILWLSELKLNVSTEPSPYTPTTTLPEIRDFVKNSRYSGEEWDFPAHGEMKINKKMVTDLLYYALKGDKSAELMLSHYAPRGASEGEWAAGLLEWYDFTVKSPTASQVAN